jgi:hypothetical protein
VCTDEGESVEAGARVEQKLWLPCPMSITRSGRGSHQREGRRARAPIGIRV